MPGNRSGDGATRGPLPRRGVPVAPDQQGEAVAYVSAAARGVEVPSSADYVLSWSGNAEQLRAALATVQRLVRRVLGIVGEPGEPAPGREGAKAA